MARLTEPNTISKTTKTRVIKEKILMKMVYVYRKNTHFRKAANKKRNTWPISTSSSPTQTRQFSTKSREPRTKMNK